MECYAMCRIDCKLGYIAKQLLLGEFNDTFYFLVVFVGCSFCKPMAPAPLKNLASTYKYILSGR